MRHVRLGQTDLEVSTTAFGTWALGGDWGAADLEDSRDAIHRALALGINLFDTAQGYGFGAPEQLLGDALRQPAEREDVIIATKGGLRKDGDRLVRDASREWLRGGVEALTTLDERPQSAYYWQLTLLAAQGAFLFGFDTLGLVLRTQMPESPRWLLRHGRYDQLRKAMAT